MINNQEYKAFDKLFNRLAQKYGDYEVFSSFLLYIASGFCADGTINFETRYSKEEFALFYEMYKEYTLIMNEHTKGDD
ncbi:MAG: hypothetical protein LBF04_07125 [Prevotellaceae bacterium]|jgi:hypothetical protein|nr:hypothetical protein [Prevotellaceae bacterium]